MEQTTTHGPIVSVKCVKCKAEILCNMTFCPYCGKRQGPTPRKHLKRANGTGSVYKMSGNRARPWTAYKGGKYLGYYATKKEAQTALERFSGKNPSEVYNYTFAEVYEAWKPSHFPDVGEAGRKQYEISFAVFSDLHAKKFRELRTNDFQAILDRHADKSVNTVGKYKQLLTQMSEWAIENELIPTNFASYCKARGRDPRHHEPMTAEEISLIEKDGSEAARIVLMLLATGMRIGELFALRLDDYHDTYCVGGEKTDAGRDRIVPIRPEGREHFEFFCARAKAKGGARIVDGFSGNKNPDNFRKRDYAALLDRLGIDPGKTPHSTRTTYGTRAATEDELAPAVLQKVMGHSSFNTTQKYYNRPDAEALVKAVEGK